MNKQQLASTIWESANQMRSKIEANEYKDFILGFIFYKYLSEREVLLMKKEGFTDEKIKKVNEKDKKYAQHVRNELGYFISYDNLFSTWLEKGKDFDVSNVTDALSDFDANIDKAYKKVFEKIFDTLREGLSKLGDTAPARTKAIRGLLKLIRRIPMDGKQDYDVLGFIYEYLISMFAANAGKKAGEFYTPHEVSMLMSDIIADHLKDREQIKIYDPTSGSGSLLINIGHSVAKYMSDADKIEYYAQELIESTYNLTRMNLVMRGIKPANLYVRNGDTLDDDWPFFEDNDKEKTYELVNVDAVVSNPPYSQKWNPADADSDPRFNEYGVAPKAKADLAFLLHDLYHLKNDGIMTVVLPHGVLFRGGEEGKIRKNLIEKNRIDTIIGLPEKIFFGTGIKTIIMVLKRERPTTDVLIIDASKGYVKDGRNNRLRACDIKRIVDTIRTRSTQDKFSAVVSKKEIKENGYNLNLARYVDSSDAPETWDIRATMFGGIPDSEVDELSDFWEAMPGLKGQIFQTASKGYVSVRDIDIKDVINAHESIGKYRASFETAFNGLYEQLKRDLIDDILDVQSEPEKERITTDIFKRIGKVALTDRYQAYQVLAEKWDIISADLEMIQGEGFEVINQVDPNMVIKKKDKDSDEVPEVQEGWRGHILPFDLIQRELLTDEYESLNAMERRLSEISVLYTEIIDSMEAEDKEGNSILNDTNDAFMSKELKAAVAVILDDIEDDEINALRDYLKFSKKKDKLDYAKNCGSVHWDKLEQGSDGTYKKGSVTAYIKELQMAYDFDEDSLDGKLVKALKLMEEETRLKKDIKQKSEELHLRTKAVIEELDEDTSLRMLELKWIKPLVDGLHEIGNYIIGEYTRRIIALADKYKTTLSDVEEEIEGIDAELAELLGDVTGSKADMDGLAELRKILEV